MPGINRRLVAFLLMAGVVFGLLGILVEPSYGLQVTYLSRPFGSSTTTLYRFDVSQRSTTVLLENPGLQKFVWSPDGRYLLLTMRVSFEGGSRDPLYIYEVATRREWLLVENAYAYGNASWSPDSHHIVYTKPFEQGVGVFTIDLTGRDERFITSTEVYPWYPTWSPDGKWIAFTDYFDNLFVVSAEGGTAQALYSSGGYVGGRLAPLWSSDSQRLIYYREGAIYCALIALPAEELCGADADSPPGVAPDNRLAFTSDSPTSTELWIVSPPGLTPRSYTLSGAEQLLVPHWSSDGEHILVSAIMGRREAYSPVALYDFEPASGTWELLDTVVAMQTAWRP